MIRLPNPQNSPGRCRGIPSLFGAETTHEIDDEANHENQTDATAANGRSSKIEPAATEQKEQDEQDNDEIHVRKLLGSPSDSYGGLHPMPESLSE